MLQKPPKSQGPQPEQCKPGPGNNMVSRRNHLLHHFSTTTRLHLASFYAKKHFLRKNQRVEMLNEEIIAFELSGPGTLAVHVLL